MNACRPLIATTVLLASIAALPATADGRTSDGEARVRVIHASPDAPAVDILLNNTTAAFTSVLFGDATDYADVPANVYDVKVVPAGAGPGAAVIDVDLNLFYGTEYTIVAVGPLGSIKPLVLVDDAEVPAGGEARVRFVHAVPDAPTVDIKVVDGPFLFRNVAFESVADHVTLPRGEYTLEVRVAGTDMVALTVPGVAFRGGTTYTLLATGLLGEGTLDASVIVDDRQARGVTPSPPLLPRPLAGVDLSRVSPDGGLR